MLQERLLLQHRMLLVPAEHIISMEHTAAGCASALMPVAVTVTPATDCCYN